MATGRAMFLLQKYIWWGMDSIVTIILLANTYTKVELRKNKIPIEKLTFTKLN